MKTHKLLLLLIAAAAALALGSCAELAGATLRFDENGNLTIGPPSQPITIPVEPSK